MVTTAIISLRETFETALILCVLLSYFTRYKQYRAIMWMWMGTGFGIFWSVGFAFVLIRLHAMIPSAFEEIYEGTMMIAAALLLSWMIVWMTVKGRDMKASLERSVAEHVTSGYLFGILITSFLATAREGTELVILTHAALLQSGEYTLGIIGSGIGIAFAIGLGWILFQGSRKLPLNLFFVLTSAMLIVIAVALMQHGIHELAEAHVVPEHWMMERGVIALFGIALVGVWLTLFRSTSSTQRQRAEAVLHRE
ncbi:MAG: FTR1 family protein [Candidatus Peribacteraceae bacterium]